jgi:cell division protein FtsB
MKNKNSTKKYFILSVIILIVALVLFVVSLFFINQEKEKVKQLSNDLSIAQKEDVVALKRAIRNYEASADLVKNLLVDKEKVFDFISEVELLAKNSGAAVSVQNIDLFDVVKGEQLVRNTGVETPGRIHGKFVMSLRVEGSWEAVSEFLLKMESFPKHTIIDSVSLNSVFDATTKRQTWVGNFNIITTTN